MLSPMLDRSLVESFSRIQINYCRRITHPSKHKVAQCAFGTNRGRLALHHPQDHPVLSQFQLCMPACYSLTKPIAPRHRVRVRWPPSLGWGRVLCSSHSRSHSFSRVRVGLFQLHGTSRVTTETGSSQMIFTIVASPLERERADNNIHSPYYRFLINGVDYAIRMKLYNPLFRMVVIYFRMVFLLYDK